MEFLIRRTDDILFDLQYNQLPSVLHPNSFPYTQVSGEGDVRLQVQDTTIICIDEMLGYQIVFEGAPLPEDVALQIVKEMLENITSVTGQTGEIFLMPEHRPIQFQLRIPGSKTSEGDTRP